MGIGDLVLFMMIVVFWLNIGGSIGGEVGLKSLVVVFCISVFVLVVLVLINVFVVVVNFWVNLL